MRLIESNCIACGSFISRCLYGASYSRLICSECREQFYTKAFHSICDFNALFPYELKYAAVYRALKFDGCLSLIQFWENIVSWHLLQNEGSWECVVPVPGNPANIFFRGWDPVLKICTGLSARFKIPLFPSIGHRLFQRSQKKLNRINRIHHVRNKFYLKNFLYNNLNVLLVDDVHTTGATLHACSDLLLQSGAKSVTSLAFLKDTARGLTY